MSVGIVDAITRRDALLGTGGKTTLHLAYPDEFELYVFAFEVVDKDFKTRSYFLFPVNPNSITEQRNEITNIKKTSGGVTVLSNPNFIPIDITINGSFGGSKFKVLLGETYQDLFHDFQDNGINLQSQILYSAQQVFDTKVKTGYGCTKILEKMLLSLKNTDANGPYKLIFYNLAFDTTYLVQPVNYSFSQSPESNMIWNYSLQLKAVANAKNLVGTDTLKSDRQLTLDNYTQKQVNNVLNEINKIKI